MIIKGKLDLNEWILAHYDNNLLHLLSIDGKACAIVKVTPKWETGEVYAQEHRKTIDAVNKVPPIRNLIDTEEGKHEVMRRYLQTFMYEVWFEGPADPTQWTDVTVAGALVGDYIKMIFSKRQL